MNAFESAFEALRKAVGDVEADRLLTAVENEKLREAAKELTNLPLWYTADLHADWETGVQEAAKRVQEMADATSPAAAPVPDETGEAPRCTCARSCGLHSKGCAKYAPGHELASPAAELERLRIFALATNRRHQEIRDRLALVDIRESAEAWDLGMAVLALLEGPLPRNTEAGDQR